MAGLKQGPLPLFVHLFVSLLSTPGAMEPLGPTSSGPTNHSISDSE